MIQQMIALSAVAVMALSGTAAGAVASTAPPDANEQDRRFLVQAHQDNLAGITAGRAAVRKGHDRDVRALGRRLVTDHTRLDAEVRQVAQRLSVSLPEEATTAQRIQYNRISARNGDAFDWAWLSVAAVDRRAALARGAKELADGSSAQVKRLAADARPVLLRHLELLRRHSGSGATAGEPGRPGRTTAETTTGTTGTTETVEPFLIQEEG
ncbi:DUF4142 domain-containing protein [Streptosporangium sp. NPDC000239]|uniref:DUF4142 domain-containing protein n=2 Tax=unclassified Streptosporangium TaxID=2632669 RepID=UPI00331B821E